MSPMESVMTTVFTGTDVGAAIRRVALALVESKDRFNKLDAAGGDGDMGTTLATVSLALLADETIYPNDVGESLMRIAKTIARTSGSSLSAVVMTGLITLGKTWSAKHDVAWIEMAPALSNALETMQARSKARPGDKTVLDGIARVARNIEGISTAEKMSATAQQATADALAEFRSCPAIIGRLRLEPSKGIGSDDPGMVALHVAVSAMAGSLSNRAVGESNK
ncbi:MAG: dihydroxyacetone kinase subunit L [Mesorhizobium sp.]|nr:MAG: DAK2 domain-containing protein [Mesorhizobium sp.]TIO54321.1 MAG: dihydroxyacetone kinase subunit L [Mesorhizobium sp.]TIO59461.1 MAG: dihydroxyacetone kinase subunit L [Mesorhizobium sp.]TJV63884.1 MAG: dihydroxyacetone kinase subunit L [Mesorhizobium sp.]